VSQSFGYIPKSGIAGSNGSLIHFELILVQGEIQESSSSLLRLDFQFPQQHLFKKLSFLHDVF
jgi:hypothetical protein